MCLKMNAVGIKIHFFIFTDLSYTKLPESMKTTAPKKKKEGEGSFATGDKHSFKDC